MLFNSEQDARTTITVNQLTNNPLPLQYIN